MLAGTLPLRYCAAAFATKTPSWKIPFPGHVVILILLESRDEDVPAGMGGLDSVDAVESGGAGGHWEVAGRESD